MAHGLSQQTGRAIQYRNKVEEKYFSILKTLGTQRKLDHKEKEAHTPKMQGREETHGEVIE